MAITSVRVALEMLPDRLRIALELRFYDGKSCSQMAAIMGVSKMTAWRILQRAMARIRFLLTNPSTKSDDLFNEADGQYTYWQIR